MAKLLQSVLVNNVTVASAQVLTYDLAVNPLSVIYLVLRPLNNTGTLSNYASSWELASALNSVRVLYRGASVIHMTGQDLVFFNWARWGFVPRELNAGDTDNDQRGLVVPVVLGKMAYESESCFPATRRGELTLELDLNASGTGWDGLRVGVETAELLGATPNEFERRVMIRGTFGSTGEQTVPLPVGNWVRGVLLWGTTGYTGPSPAPTFGRTQLLLNNQQEAYSAVDPEVMAVIGQMNGRGLPYGLDGHLHRVNAASASTTEATFADPVGPGVGLSNYSFLDLDPSRDDEFGIDTNGVQNFTLKTNVGTANAFRIVAVEKVSTASIA